MDIRFDVYYNNEELDARLQWLVENYSDILEMRSLGESHEGRNIPLIVISGKNTEPDIEKPGFWVDGNIHSTEVASSALVLYLIHNITQRYKQDDQLKQLLDRIAIYAVPRLNPDGAALALSKNPKHYRSGTRPLFDHLEQGIQVEDFDEDGRILQMRVKDPTGDWKECDRDPRLMVKRGPSEEGGTYYRMFSEGVFKNFDPDIISQASSVNSLDFNRNFPKDWRPDGVQKGAGDHPGSEPEIQAVLKFFAEHHNIYGALTYHTFSRVILRPFSGKTDNEMPTNDLWVYEAIGEIGTAKTNYPCVSVFHDFKYHPNEVITGAFDDWVFEQKGIFSFTIELWDLPSAAGIKEKNEEKNFIGWLRKHSLEDDYKILEFAQKEANDRLVSWYKCQHPQLGEVELGGWQHMYTWRNPPHHLLEKEIAPQVDFILEFASLAPHLKWRKLEVSALGEDHFQIRALIENTGFLPTYISEQAKKIGAINPVQAKLSLPEGTSLKSGKQKEALGHLEGRSNKLDISYASSSPTDNRARIDWIVYAPKGGTVSVEIFSERAGVLRRQVELRSE